MVHDARQHSPEVIERLQRFNPRVLKSELSPEEEAALTAALAGR
jgi:uncharacterized membrane protein